MTDLKTQLVRLGAHLDDTVPAVDEDESLPRMIGMRSATVLSPPLKSANVFPN